MAFTGKTTNGSGGSSGINIQITGSGSAAAQPFTVNSSNAFSYTLTDGQTLIVPSSKTTIGNITVGLSAVAPSDGLITKLYYQTELGGAVTLVSGLSVTIASGDKYGTSTTTVSIPAGAKYISVQLDPGAQLYSGTAKVLFSLQ